MLPRRVSRLLAVLAALAVLAGCGGGSSGGKASTVSASGNIDGVMIEHATGRSHRSGHVDYPGPLPPSGGDHSPVWLNCGVYSTPQPLENTVHDLEHGAVWIAYAPSTSAADLAVIRKLASADHVVATPLDGMAAPIVMVAWERRLNLDSINDPRAAKFVAAFSTGATAPEKGAPCTGGVGTPE